MSDGSLGGEGGLPSLHSRRKGDRGKRGGQGGTGQVVQALAGCRERLGLPPAPWEVGGLQIEGVGPDVEPQDMR